MGMAIINSKDWFYDPRTQKCFRWDDQTCDHICMEKLWNGLMSRWLQLVHWQQVINSISICCAKKIIQLFSSTPEMNEQSAPSDWPTRQESFTFGWNLELRVFTDISNLSTRVILSACTSPLPTNFASRKAIYSCRLLLRCLAKLQIHFSREW